MSELWPDTVSKMTASHIVTLGSATLAYGRCVPGSPKETGAASDVLIGSARNTIAIAYVASIHTTRTYLKRIQDKVGANERTGLAPRLRNRPIGPISGS